MKELLLNLSFISCLLFTKNDSNIHVTTSPCKITSSECLGLKFGHFMVTSPEGETLSSSDVKNKVVFITFIDTSSIYFKREIEALNELQAKVKDNSDFKFVCISTNENPTIISFKKEHNIQYPVYHMNGKDCMKLTYQLGIPSSFVLSRDGKIRHYERLIVEDSDEAKNILFSDYYPLIVALLGNKNYKFI